MSGHTPGPWGVEKDRFNNFQVYAENKNILDDLPVADNIIDEANARLIAAAPELLEAVKTMAAYYNDEINLNGTAIKFMLDKAISKAESFWKRRTFSKRIPRRISNGL